MNEKEIELRVQSLVDGEITGREAEELRVSIEGDAGLRELQDRLTVMRGLMKGAELLRSLPDSGDFHWSRIAEAIEHEEGKVKRKAKPISRIRWFLFRVTPWVGFACILLLLSSPSQHNVMPDLGIKIVSDHELELSDDDIDVMTFNTVDDDMSVVWLDFSIDLRP